MTDNHQPTKPSRAVHPDADETDVNCEVGAYCPRCSTRLINRRCKLLCERCGYFMSCSDFDR